MSQGHTSDPRDTLKRLYLAFKAERRLREDLETSQSEPIAVIGMGCRFPAGANDPHAFWTLLEGRRDGVSTVPAERWDAAAYLAADAADRPGTMVTAQGGFLDVPLTRFDYPFFRLSPKEARAMDPQQRLLLEVAWEALESAFLVPGALKGSRTGVFIGLSADDYTLAHRHSGDLAAIDAYAITGSTPSTAAGRIAYLLGLEGPAVPVDTACSSSLVALHFAVQSLRARETDLCLAGGVNLILSPSTHVCFSRLHAISPDGRSKPFSAAANGYGRGEGCGMVVLKRLGDARRDGDRVLAVIAATAVNQDGASNGFTAPNGAAQKRLLAEALHRARLQPADIQYVETHGTGTPLGDPIEADALAEVLGRDRNEAPLILGALKSNIGHLEAAAGIASVIKTVQALRHGRIPGNLHFEKPNPLIPWATTKLAVPTEATAWPAGADGRRHAGISSFGFSGTNAHLILSSPEPEAAEETASTGASDAGPWLLALSARTPQALQAMGQRLATRLRHLGPDESVRDVCATLLRHRSPFEHRRALIGRDAGELADRLERGDDGEVADAPEVLRTAASQWRARRSLDADALFPDRTYRRIDLPTYPFDPLPCALGPLDGPVIPTRALPSSTEPHPMLQRVWRSPLIGEVLWQSEIDLERLPVFAEHRVFGRPVMAAAGFLSMLLAAARLARPDAGPLTLRNVRFPAALPLPEQGAVTLHLVLRPPVHGARALELASLDSEGGLARLHASAELVDEEAVPQVGAWTPPGPDAETLSPQAVFGRQEPALTVGVSLRWAESARREPGRAVVRLLPPPGVDAAPWSASFHPGLLDTALHLLALHLPVPDGSVLVPVAIDRLTMAGTNEIATWAEARPGGNDRGDITLWTADGRPWLSLSGVRGQVIGDETRAKVPLHRQAWHARPQAGATRPPGRWAVILPKHATREWRTALAARWPDAALWPPDAVECGEAESIVWLGGLDPAAMPGERLLALLPLARRLAEGTAGGRLWIATAGAQQAHPDDALDPTAAELWGFGRSLAREAPGAWGGLVDLPEGAGPESADALLAALADAAPGVERAVRGRAVLAPELLPLVPSARATPAQIRHDATYLVTGGTGALGLRLAAWLVEHGARSLVLVGRRTPSTDAEAQIAALQDAGARVTVECADAADADAMASLLARIDSGLPPLAGVFHLAGVPAGGLIHGLDAAAVQSGLAGKATGALVLDRLTRNRTLDLFVSFSSVAGWIGAAGQSVYAAANAVLDGLAAARRHAGLPALSIAWGPWAGAGMAAADGVAAQMERLGLGLLQPDAALTTLETLLWQADAVSVVVGRLGRPAQAAQAAPASRPLAEHLRAVAADVLGAACPEDIPTDRDLFTLGLDSLMALRLRDAAEAASGRALPATFVFEHPSLEALVGALGDAAPKAAPTPSARVTADPAALSAGQRGVWLAQQLVPDSASFHTCFPARIRSRLDVAALERSFIDVISRHAPLHGSIEVVDGLPRRRPVAPDTFRLERHDAVGREAESLRPEMDAAYRRPFRLDRDLPVRAVVWHLGDEDHLLLVVIHHAAIDVRSFARLLDELRDRYTAQSGGAAASVAPPERDYQDYVAWQNGVLAGPEGERLRQYWSEQLAGVATPPPPPLARSDGTPRREGWTLHLEIDEHRAAALEALGQRHGATLTATLLALWCAVAARFTGSDEVVVGTPTLGRSRSEWADTVGFFVNVVPLRIALGDRPGWPALIERARRALAGAFAHQDLPFRDIVALTGPAALDDVHPLVNTLFHLRGREEGGELEPFFVPGRVARVPFGQLALEPFYIEQQEGQYPLTVEWFRTGDGLHGMLKVDAGCYEAAAAESLREVCRQSIDALLATPDATPETLDLLDEHGRAELAGWHAPAAPLPSPTRIDRRFAAQAARTPEAVALVVQGGSVSYRQLDRRVNALAHRLVAAGVSPGARVGLCAERSAGLVTAVLAILKCSATYVALPPDAPHKRLAVIVAEAGLAAIAGEGETAAALATATALPLVPLGGHDEAADPPSVDESVEAAAYVLFTSGTTGRPKGVEVGHAAVSSFLDAFGARYPQGPDEATLLKTPLSFDPSVAELFLPLTSGGRLVVAGPQDHRDPAALAALIAAERVTQVLSVPSQIRELVEEDAAAGWSRVRRVVCGGERLPAGLARRFAQRVPGGVLINAYGPTEATVLVTTWECRGEAESEPVPLGRPLDNARVLVLDHTRRPLPVGAVGELYLGGPCLAHGYLGRRDLTEAAFVADPLIPGERLYRSGDLGRLVRGDDGCLVLQFLGRADRQVKLRGQRVELEEIEAVARTAEGVLAAAARMITAPSGEAVLAVAVVPTDPAVPPHAGALSAHAALHLPSGVAPRHWLVVSRLPQTTHGKLDGEALDRQLAATFVTRGTAAGAAAASQGRPLSAPTGDQADTTQRAIAGIWAEVLGLPEVGLDQHFFDLGGSSLLLARVRHRLEQRGLGPVSLLDLVRHPTIADLAAFLDGARPQTITAARVTGSGSDHAIAVIGMSARVPGATDLDSFWQLSVEGREGLTRFTREELLAAGVRPEEIDDPHYVPVNGVIDGVEEFDARFFGYSPREAELLDPQQRLFLHAAWHALEHAGYGRQHLSRAVGVFAGCEISSYLLFNLASRLDSRELNGGYELALANDKDFLATRVAYAFDLHGPAMAIQTACSTSLTAVTAACDALVAGRCEMALAGGVALHLPQRQGYRHRVGLVASPSGHCRPFDAAAGGTVNGNGVGVVVLKPLARALADGDTIHAVIRGWGLSNDGTAKLGFTAPSEEAQARAIAQAWAHAGIAPERLGLIEAHGTGTALGDPIEVAALRRAWGDRPVAGGPCWLGAVKSNIGHLGAAAGVSGLIRTVLAVEHRTIPPVVGFTQANPAIGFEGSPFAVSATAREWPDRGGPATAGVSSFGIGGTNVHVVVEAAPAPASPPEDAAWQVLPVSAGSREGLDRAVDALTARLEEERGPSMADTAFTLQEGREAFAWRTAVVARDRTEAARRLKAAAGVNTQRGTAPVVGALFPGQGAQHPDMLLDLYRDLPAFRAEIDTGLEHLGRLPGGASAKEWRAALFPSLERPATPERRAEAAAFLAQTRHTQPALFLVEYALARLWEHLGVVPAAMLGHSVGEYVAAALAGVFRPEDALALVAARGRLMQSLPEGKMLAVAQAAERVVPLLDAGLSLAGDNGPAQCVIAGRAEAIEAARHRFEQQGIVTHLLATSHAFHSAMIDPILPEFGALVSGVERKRPTRRIVSCLTGDWLDPDRATDPEYWVAQARGTVRFRQGIASLLASGVDALLEIGPGKGLTAQARALCGNPAPALVASARRAGETCGDREPLLVAVAALWQLGTAIAWSATRAEGTPAPRRVPLPLYPFDSKRYWIEPGTSPAHLSPERGTVTTAGSRDGVQRKALDRSARFHVPHWSPTPLPAPPDTAGDSGPWLIVPDQDGTIAAALADRLAALGIDVSIASDRCTWREDCVSRRVIHLAAAGADRAEARRGLDSLIAFAQAAERRPRSALDLLIAGSGVQDVMGGESNAWAATLLGPAMVIPRELPWVRCRLIDLEPGASASVAAAQLLDELGAEATEPLAAYRRGRRLVRAFDRLAISEGGRSLLRQGGVYLVTGGAGGLGLAVAGWLTRTFDARLILLGRTLPESLAPDRRERLRGLGDSALYLATDVTDPDAVAAALAAGQARFGPINGVFHAAGVGTATRLADLTPARTSATLAPKVEGTLNLFAAVDPLPLDFTVLFSSSSAVLGRAGLLDYAAANAFLDACASRRSAEGRPTLSIGWDAWAGVGLSAGTASASQRQARQALTEAEGLDALARLLTRTGLPHVVVTHDDVESMLSEIASSAEACRPAMPAAAPSHPRPDLATPFLAPTGPIEQAVAGVWRDILGIEAIGADDNFFDLGGDSLIGSRLIAQVNEALGVSLSPVVLYEAPTVRALAGVIGGTAPAADLAEAAPRPTRRRRTRTDQGDLL